MPGVWTRLDKGHAPARQSALRQGGMIGGPVKLRDALDAISVDGQHPQVYSQPFETADGTTVIAVSKIRGRVRPADAATPETAGEQIAVRAKPIGVFAIRDGEIKWMPAVDATPIALIGVITGLVAAALCSAAVLRRPPWPDLRQTI